MQTIKTTMKLLEHDLVLNMLVAGQPSIVAIPHYPGSHAHSFSYFIGFTILDSIPKHHPVAVLSGFSTLTQRFPGEAATL